MKGSSQSEMPARRTDTGIRPVIVRAREAARWLESCLSHDMRIVVTGKDVTITDQLQAYTEYRLFTSIARYETLIRGVQVTLQQHVSHRDPFLCLIVVDLHSSGQIKARARGSHPNAAIDRVSGRTASLLGRHASREVTS
jgi:ribosomal subunit interface protein